MFAHHQTVANAPTVDGAAASPLSSPLRVMTARLVAWARACGDCYAAAAMYEQLSTLSDAELTRRGLSRATLARDVGAACDRP